MPLERHKPPSPLWFKGMSEEEIVNKIRTRGNQSTIAAESFGEKFEYQSDGTRFLDNLNSYVTASR